MKKITKKNCWKEIKSKPALNSKTRSQRIMEFKVVRLMFCHDIGFIEIQKEKLKIGDKKVECGRKFKISDKKVEDLTI